MSDVQRLLNFTRRLEVWRIPSNDLAVAYDKVEVKDGGFLVGEFGVGQTFEDACTDYMSKISGKTLVWRDELSGARKEAVVL